MEFRRIPSLGYQYEISFDGTVLRNVKTGHILKQIKTCHNSDTVYLSAQVFFNGKNRKLFIHRAVAECWLGPRPKGMQVDHIDRNSLNNHYKNLRYVSKSKQMKNRDYSAFIDVLYNNLSKSFCKTVYPVTLIDRNNKVVKCSSRRRAAKYLAVKNSGQSEASIYAKLARGVHELLGYYVEYPKPKGNK